MAKYIKEAQRVTTGPRRRDYDVFLINALKICLLQNVYKAGSLWPGEYITPLDVSVLNILQKVARESKLHKDDNFVDIIGYSDLVGEMDDYLKEIGYDDGVKHLEDMDVGDMFQMLLELGPHGEEYKKHFKEKSNAKSKEAGSYNERGRIFQSGD